MKIRSGCGILIYSAGQGLKKNKYMYVDTPSYLELCINMSTLLLEDVSRNCWMSDTV